MYTLINIRYTHLLMKLHNPIHWKERTKNKLENKFQQTKSIIRDAMKSIEKQWWSFLKSQHENGYLGLPISLWPEWVFLQTTLFRTSLLIRKTSNLFERLALAHMAPFTLLLTRKLENIMRWNISNATWWHRRSTNICCVRSRLWAERTIPRFWHFADIRFRWAARRLRR